MYYPTLAYTQQRRSLTDNLAEIETFIKSYEELNKLYDEIPKKVQHEVMVPFLGSSQVLVKGIIYSTNETYVQLGSDLFVKRLIPHAAKSAQKRLILANEMKRDCVKSINELDKRKEFAEQLDLGNLSTEEIHPGSDQARDFGISATNEGNVMPEYSKDATEEEQQRPKGSVRKTAEGFLEIIERMPEEGGEGPVSKPVTGSLIEKISTEEVSQKRTAESKRKPSSSIFSQEFSRRGKMD